MYVATNLLDRTYMCKGITYRHWSYPAREVGRAATAQHALMACTGAASTASQSNACDDPAPEDDGCGSACCSPGLLLSVISSAVFALSATCRQTSFMKSSSAFMLIDFAGRKVEEEKQVKQNHSHQPLVSGTSISDQHILFVAFCLYWPFAGRSTFLVALSHRPGTKSPRRPPPQALLTRSLFGLLRLLPSVLVDF